MKIMMFLLLVMMFVLFVMVMVIDFNDGFMVVVDFVFGVKEIF